MIKNLQMIMTISLTGFGIFRRKSTKEMKINSNLNFVMVKVTVSEVNICIHSYVVDQI